MKFTHVVSALALLPAATAFAPAPTSSRTQTSLNAIETPNPIKLGIKFFDAICDDRNGKEEEEIDSITSRFQNLKNISDDIKKAGVVSKEESDANEAEAEYAPFKHLPTEDQTGVEEHITRFAASLSDQLYKVPDPNQPNFPKIALSTKDYQVDVIIEDLKGKFQPTNPPFGAVVVGDTMIIGWRGSNTPTDWLIDFSWAPCRNLSLGKFSKNIKLQAGMSSLVANDLVNHQDTIIEECKKRGIKEIVTTGHSLGGGLAQISHTILRAQIMDENSAWSALDGVNVRSVGFSGPMTTQLLKEEMTEESKQFIQDVAENSCMIIYHNDVVPRSYGFNTYMIDCLEDVAGDIGQYALEGKKLPLLLPKAILDKFASTLVEAAQDAEAFKQLCAVWSSYIHVGTISSYTSPRSKPKTLIDLGAFHANPENKDTLRSETYENSGWFKNAVQDLLENHMHVIQQGCVGYPYDDFV